MNDEQPATPQPAEPVAWLYFDPHAPVQWTGEKMGRYKVDDLLPHRVDAFPVYRATATPQQPAAASAGASERLTSLIYEYWAIAYREGKENRDHDTEAGDAARCWHEISTEIANLARAALQSAATK